MGDRTRPTRILCINCNICVNTLRRYRALEFDTKITTLLCQWAHPIIITQDDYICEACRDLAMVSVNDNNLQQEVASNDSQQAGPSHRGHTDVCISCGRSIKRRQSDRIIRDNPSDLQQSISNILQSRVVPRQITESDRVCHPCWLQVRREALKMNLHDHNRSQHESPVEYQEEDQPHSDSNLQNNGSLRSDSNHQNDASIVLTNYRRAPNNNRRCVFPSCSATKLHGISDKLRAIILSNHNYYLPKLVRVCAEHLVSNTWDALFESENSMNTFNAEQIQHVFSFVNTSSPTLDFENIHEMDDRIFEYFTGWTKESFNHFLEEVPRIREMHRGNFGLAMLLLKTGTGRSNEKISTLVQVPRRTLEILMDKVRKILLQDVIPQNIEFMNLQREDFFNQNNLSL